MACGVLTLPPFTGRSDGVVTGGAMVATIAWRHGGTQSFIMFTFTQALYSNAPTPASAGPIVDVVPIGPTTPVRSNRVNPGRKYISTVEEENTIDTVCNFCGKFMKGGITRAKEHLMIKPGNVVGCKIVPKDVIVEL
ncbi:hypothetical protein AHAS_Ahas10G0062500 [Arachis hypogaea]